MKSEFLSLEFQVCHGNLFENWRRDTQFWLHYACEVWNVRVVCERRCGKVVPAIMPVN